MCYRLQCPYKSKWYVVRTLYNMQRGTQEPKNKGVSTLSHTNHVLDKLFCIPLIYHFPIRMNLLRIDSVQSTLHGALTFLGYSQH